MRDLCGQALHLIPLEFWIFLSLLKRGPIDDSGRGKGKGESALILCDDFLKIGRDRQGRRPLEQEGPRYPTMGLEQLGWTHTGTMARWGGWLLWVLWSLHQNLTWPGWRSGWGGSRGSPAQDIIWSDYDLALSSQLWPLGWSGRGKWEICPFPESVWGLSPSGGGHPMMDESTWLPTEKQPDSFLVPGNQNLFSWAFWFGAYIWKSVSLDYSWCLDNMADFLWLTVTYLGILFSPQFRLLWRE